MIGEESVIPSRQIALGSGVLSLAGLWILAQAISLMLWLPYVAGAVALGMAFIRIRKEFARARGVERITLFGPIFLAIPMAVFGGDHFVFTRSIAQLVPSWIPGHIFWVLFVGVCLIAGAFGLLLDRYAILAAALLGTMLILFVLLMDIPSLVQVPRNRILWAASLRDLTFGAGALAFALAHSPKRWKEIATTTVTLIRVEMGLAAIFFAVEHFLHPEFMPGVPLKYLTPSWIPLRVTLGYVTGAILLITGLGLLWSKTTKLAAIGLGVTLLLLVILLYAPIMIAQPRAIEVGLNYLANTMMYSGSMLCLAGSFCQTETPAVGLNALPILASTK